MPTIAEFRAQNPQYQNLSDEDIAGGLHVMYRQKFGDIARDEFDSLIGFEKPEPTRSALEYVTDPLSKLVSGTMDLPRAALGLADVVTTPVRPEGWRTLTQTAADAGVDFKGAQKIIDQDWMSDAARAENQRTAAAFDQGLGAGAKELASNPMQIAGLVAQTAPSMLGIAGGVRALANSIYSKAAISAGGVGTAEGIAAGEAAVQAAMPTLSKLAAGLEGAQTAGMMGSDRAAEGTLDNRGALSALGAGVATAGIGQIANRIGGSQFGQRLGLGDVETQLATGALRPAAGGRQFVGGMVREGLIEEAPQSASEQMFSNIADRKEDITEGTGTSAVMGGMVGAVAGGAFNLMARSPEVEAARPGNNPGNEAESKPVPVVSADEILGFSQEKQRQLARDLGDTDDDVSVKEGVSTNAETGNLTETVAEQLRTRRLIDTEAIINEPKLNLPRDNEAFGEPPAQPALSREEEYARAIAQRESQKAAELGAIQQDSQIAKAEYNDQIATATGAGTVSGSQLADAFRARGVAPGSFPSTVEAVTNLEKNVPVSPAQQWADATPEQRIALAANAGWRTSKGEPNAQAKRFAGMEWAKLPVSTIAKIEAQLKVANDRPSVAQVVPGSNIRGSDQRGGSGGVVPAASVGPVGRVDNAAGSSARGLSQPATMANASLQRGATVDAAKPKQVATQAQAAVDAQEAPATIAAAQPETGKFALGDRVNDASKQLRATARAKESAGDVLLDNGKFASFDEVVSLTREGIDSGAIKPVPAQIQSRLDLSFRDVDRVLAAAKTKPLLESRSEPAETRMTDDVDAQVKWLDDRAQDAGYADVRQMATQAPDKFVEFASQWRDDHPVAGAMLSTRKKQEEWSASEKYQVTRMPNPNIVQVIGADVYSVKRGEDGTLSIKYQPPWGSKTKEFTVTGNSVDEVVDAAESRLKRSNAALKVKDEYKEIPSGWSGELKEFARSLADNGVSIARYSKSERSKSAYIELTNGDKIRLSDHDLPLGYDQADYDIRFGGDMKAKAKQLADSLVVDDKPIESRSPYAGMTKAADVQTAVNKTLGGSAKRVEIYQTQEDARAALGDRGEALLSDAPGNLEGFYDPGTGRVVLIADAFPDTARAKWVAFHELTHRGMRIEGAEAYLKALGKGRAYAPIQKLATAIAADRGLSADQLDLATEEAMAELSAAAKTGNFAELEQRYGIELTDKQKADLQLSSSFFGRLWSELKMIVGRIMGRDVSDLEMGKLLSHTLAAADKEFTRDATEDLSETDTMEDYVGELESRASEVTKTAAFKRWFGDSQLKDSNGDPIVFYHGTTKDFSSFNPEKAKETGSAIAVYLTPNRENAAFFATKEKEDDAPNIMPVFASAKKVFDYENDAALVDVVDTVFDNARRAGLIKKQGDGTDAISLFGRMDSTKGMLLYGLGDKFSNWSTIENKQVQEAIKQLGYDSFYLSEAGHKNIAIYSPNQIKSAIGNRGTFDKSGNILESRAAAPAATPSTAAKSTLELPPETPAEAAQRAVQDRFNRFAKLNEMLAKMQGAVLNTMNNVYEAATRNPGRVAQQMEDFLKHTLEPLLKQAGAAKVSREQLIEYLKAKSAPGRNAKILKINPNNKAGSGISDADAATRLAELKAKAGPKWAAIQAVGDKLQAITEKTLDIKVKAGLLTQEAADAFRASESFYVPLKEDDILQGAGMGFSVNSKEHRALGRYTEANDPMSHIIRDFERAVVAAEMNTVAHFLARLVADNKGLLGNLITINKPDKKQTLVNHKAYDVIINGKIDDSFDKLEDATDYALLEGGAVQTRLESMVQMRASSKTDDNEAVFYVNGKPWKFQFRDKQKDGSNLLAQQYKNQGLESVGPVLKVFREINNMLSKLYTAYSPDFIAKNSIRDLIGGTINLTGTEGAKVSATAVAKWFPALIEATKFSITGDHGSGKWAQNMKEFRGTGGTTGAAYVSDPDKTADKLEAALDDYAGAMELMAQGKGYRAAKTATRKTVGRLAAVIMHLNAGFENAFRLATYVAVRDARLEHGADLATARADGATAAKNVTVNFNRKGEMTPQLSAGYLFFNPAVQGTNTLYRSLRYGKNRGQAWALLGGMATIAYMLRMSWDDDDWEKVPKNIRDHNLVIKRGPKDENGYQPYTSIPLPYGHGWFANFGSAVADMHRGGDPKKAALGLAQGFVENFSPVGSPFDEHGNIGKGIVNIAPTVGAMVARPLVNVSNFGSPIRPEREGDDNKPDNLKAFRTTKGTAYDTASQALSDMAGTPYGNDWNDVSPETLKYWTSTLTGGTGRFIGDLYGLPDKAGELEEKDIPVVRAVVGRTDVRGARSQFNERVRLAKVSAEEYKLAINRHDAAEAKRIQDTQLPLIQLAKLASDVQKVVSAKRDAQDAVNQGPGTAAEKRMKLRSIELEEEKLYKLYDKEWDFGMARLAETDKKR